MTSIIIHSEFEPGAIASSLFFCRSARAATTSPLSYGTSIIIISIIFSIVIFIIIVYLTSQQHHNRIIKAVIIMLHTISHNHLLAVQGS